MYFINNKSVSKLIFSLLIVPNFISSKEVFNITPDKRIVIDKGDITKNKSQAIVNAANENLLGGAGVCGAIFNAAGWDQLQKASDVYKKSGTVACPTGQARITDSFKLKQQGVKNIIHAVGPDCRIIKDEKQQNDLLAKAYKNSLKLAEDYALESIAFPFISSAIYAFPKERASRIALQTCAKKLKESNKVQEISFVLFSQDDYDLFVNTMKKLNLVNL
jgi:O-acetyl-ADP-ribose deacetylase